MALSSAGRLAQTSKVTIASLAGACSLALLLVWRRWRRSKKLPPGSSGWPLLGETLRYVKDPTAFISTRLQEHGGTFRTNILFSPGVVLAPTEANAKLFFSKKDLGWPFHWKDVVGQASLPMINDPLHKRIRTLNGRAFTESQLDSYLPCLQSLTGKHLQSWAAASQGRGGEPQDFYFDIKRYAFDMAQSVILGVEFPLEKTDHLMHLFDETCSGLMCLMPVEIPGTFWHKVMSSRRLLVKEYQALIDRRRRELQEGAVPTSMLDSMLTADGVNSDTELQDFCIAMMFAGHDTTLSTMQSTLYWLDQKPALVAELREEVCKVWDGSSSITRETFTSVPKVRAFIQEVWRITPPVAVAVRQVQEDTMVDGYLVPKGWKINWPIAAVNHKVQSPHDFNFHRFLDKSGAFIDQTFEPSNFAVFGGGSRMCIGYKFAKDEMLMFMIQLLHKYAVTLESAQSVKFPFNWWRVTGSIRELQ